MALEIKVFFLNNEFLHTSMQITIMNEAFTISLLG